MLALRSVTSNASPTGIASRETGRHNLASNRTHALKGFASVNFSSGVVTSATVFYRVVAAAHPPHARVSMVREPTTSRTRKTVISSKNAALTPVATPRLTRHGSKAYRTSISAPSDQAHDFPPPNRQDAAWSLYSLPA